MQNKGMYLVVFLTVGFIVFLSVSVFRNQAQDNVVQLDKSLPNLDLESYYDPTQFINTKQSIKGPALINFWASWCLPCRLEHPLLLSLQEQGVNIIGINVFEEKKSTQAVQYLLDHGDPYSITLLGSPQALVEFAVPGLPYTVFMDADQNLYHSVVGQLREKDVEYFSSQTIGPNYEVAK